MNDNNRHSDREAWQEKSAYSPFSVIITFMALMIAGAAFIPILNVRFKPERNQPAVQVSFSWTGASPEAIEEQTSVIEGLLSGMAEVRTVESTSSVGQGLVRVEFDKGADLDRKRYEISMLLRQFSGKIPRGMSFPSIVKGSEDDDQPITFISMTLAGNAPTHYIGKIADQLILPGLLNIEGVADVRVNGVTPYQWEIVYDPVKMDEYGVSPDDIMQVVGRDGGRTFLGSREDEKGTMISVVLTTETQGPEKWKLLPLSLTGGRIIRLGDVANITQKEQPPASYYRINGQNTVTLALTAASKSNQIALSRKIQEKVSLIRKLLPPGYQLKIAYDSSEFIRDELVKIGERTFLSLLILLFFVLITSRSFRILAILSISLASNLLIAVVFYYLFGMEIHLYSLAGITVSFGIIIDNSIIMVNHLQRQKNLKIFTALLAATVTTLGALSVIFFLKEEQKIMLQDFALVMLINLSVSLGIALFLVPALMKQIYLRKPGIPSERKGLVRQLFPEKTEDLGNSIRIRRRIVWGSNLYTRFILFSKRFKWAFILLAVLGFGLPVWMLPDKIEKEGAFPSAYNHTLGSDFFKQKINPWMAKVMGGSLRLFSEHVYEGNFYADPGKTILYIRGKMPEGCTVHQLDEAIRKMEQYLSQFSEVEMFETRVTSYANSVIVVNFTKDSENSSFPYLLKSQVEQKATSLGGMDWNVYGVGRGFSNALNTEYRTEHIQCTGYNYRQLYHYAGILSEKLKENPRVADIDITSTSNFFYSNIRYEYSIETDKKLLALQGLWYADYAGALKEQLYHAFLPPVYADNELQTVSLVSGQYNSYNTWNFYNQPVSTSKGLKKLSDTGKITRKVAGKTIYKKDQVYYMYVNYNFIGPAPLANMIRERVINEINLTLPMGYKAQNPGYQNFWDFKDKKQYWLLLLIITIIFFTCSILFESFLKPLAVIIAIPISFIGVFLTFYLFGFNFDQGGFASFILLSGLVVNASIYIINDFNNLVRTGKIPGIKAYVKAFNQKIVPILLTILSTVLSLLPFIWGGQKEVFWFAFAAGAMGGLIFSLVAIVFYLPLFLKLDTRIHMEIKKSPILIQAEEPVKA